MSWSVRSSCAKPSRVENPRHIPRSGSSAASPGRANGFASIMAVVLLGIVTIAAFSIFAMLTADARRTRGAEIDAQLRQMLIAGAADLTEKAKSWDEKPTAAKSWNVELPPVLKQEGGVLKVVPVTQADGSVVTVIEADLQKRQAFQTIVMTRNDNRWEVHSSRWGK